MAKEVKISVKNIDKLEFYLDENAEKGDWINLNSVNEIDLSNLREVLESKKQEIIDEWKKEVLPKIKQEVLNDYKANNPEYKALKDDQKKLETAKEDYKKDLDNATAQLKAENGKLTAEISAYKDNEAKNAAEFKNKVNEEIKNRQKEIVENSIEYKELENKNKDLLQKNDILTATNNNLLHSQKSTKWVGEQLEQWILGQYEDKLSLSFGNNATFEKATINIKDPSVDEKDKGTKPDFIFSVYDVKKGSSKDNNDLNRELIDKVVIEAKNEAIGTPSQYQVKNSTHFKKLEDDRIKNNVKFAILVTELEKDKDFSIALPDPIKYPHMFMVRPEWLTALLSLLYYIIIKEAQINRHIKKNEKLEADKEKLRTQFNDFRDKLLDINLKNMKSQLDKIDGYANDIKSKADDIKEARRIIIETHIQAMETRIAKFNIDSMCRKIDRITKQEANLDDEDYSDYEDNKIEENDDSESKD